MINHANGIEENYLVSSKDGSSQNQSQNGGSHETLSP